MVGCILGKVDGSWRSRGAKTEKTEERRMSMVLSGWNVLLLDRELEAVCKGRTPTTLYIPVMSTSITWHRYVDTGSHQESLYN